MWFVIADICLKILVLNDPVDICWPNNENLIALDEKYKKGLCFMLDMICFDLQNL